MTSTILAMIIVLTPVALLCYALYRFIIYIFEGDW